MGFWHEWHFQKAYDAYDWAAVEQDARVLFKALPDLARARAKRQMKLGFSGLVLGACDMLLRDKAPAVAAFGDSMSGVNAFGLPCIAFLPSQRDARSSARMVMVCNDAGGGCAKTEAKLYDHLLMGVLCLASERQPGNVHILSSDGEADYWEHAARWASQTLGRPLPLPQGIEGAPRRQAELEAFSLGQEVSVCAPSKRGPRL